MGRMEHDFTLEKGADKCTGMFSSRQAVSLWDQDQAGPDGTKVVQMLRWEWLQWASGSTVFVQYSWAFKIESAAQEKIIYTPQKGRNNCRFALMVRSEIFLLPNPYLYLPTWRVIDPFTKLMHGVVRLLHKVWSNSYNHCRPNLQEPVARTKGPDWLGNVRYRELHAFCLQCSFLIVLVNGAIAFGWTWTPLSLHNRYTMHSPSAMPSSLGWIWLSPLTSYAQSSSFYIFPQGMVI